MHDQATEAAPCAEFDLVLACLRWPQQVVDAARIESLAREPIRWSYVLEIVHAHKVLPLFARNVETFAKDLVPADIAATLRAAATENAHTCLRRSGHLWTLNRLFREQQIAVCMLKGIPLAMIAYQDPTLRDAGDIDLLIAEKDIFEAGEILRGEGYVRFEPNARLTPRRMRSYSAHQKDFSYMHTLGGLVIDLHWKLFRNPWLPANGTLDQAGEAWVDVGAERIPTLPTPRLLVYLCVHGALDGWLRLKWLADIGALLHAMTLEDLAECVALATEQQALPQLSAAVLLCQDLLGPQPMPPGCLDREHPVVAHIISFSKRCMTSNGYRPVRERIPTAQWFLNELRQYHSPRYRADLVERSLFRPRVWQTFNLPDAFFPLYALLSPIEWLLFRIRTTHRAQKQNRVRRPAADVALALEAACMLSFFRLALKFLPVQKLTTWMGRPRHQRIAPSRDKSARTLRRVEWAIGSVGRHLPFTFVCFPQSLAAYFMLRRRNIASNLYYGVTREADQLKTHTWVKVGDRTVVGGEGEPSFTVLATFP